MSAEGAAGIAAFVVIFGAVTLWLSFRIHDKRCPDGSSYCSGYFEKHPAFCLWVGLVVVVTFSVSVSVLIDAANGDHPAGCSISVPYGERVTIACSDGES